MRKSFFLTALLIAIALGVLLILALNQYRLYGQHEQIIGQTEKFIFQYSIIREQIIEDVIDGNLNDLTEISSSVEKLHNNIIKILDNNLIPAQYKFSFLQQIDLPGLVLLLRKATTSEQVDNKLLHHINQETRVIGERFMLFERLVMGYAKQKLVDFQSVIIGILAIVLCLVTTLMLITYRMLIMPVINLAAQTENVLNGRQNKIHKTSGWQEVNNLSRKINLVLDESRSGQEFAERLRRVLNCCQHVLEKIHSVKRQDELYITACRALLTNQNYIIAWVGILDTDGKSILPVAADGSSTMTGGECQECFGALLAAKEGETDPSYQCLQTGETVIMKDILADAPKGPFKNTPLANGIVDSISLPISFENEKFCALTIYVMAQGGVLDSEAEILAQMAATLAEKLHYLALQKKLDIEKIAKKLIGNYSDIIRFNLDLNGMILAVDSYLSGSLYDDERSMHWVGSNITDIVIPENDPERMVLQSSLEERTHYEFNARITGFDDSYSAMLAPTNAVTADGTIFLMLLVPPPKNVLIQPENFQVAYSAAIGQFASSMAHEITDLSNGIINYAQMLSDEIHGNENERKKFLGKIIFGGEKVASVVEPLLVDQNDIEFSKFDENIHKIFDDVLLLVGQLFKRDGIAVHLDIQPTSLTYNKQHLQLILLTLLERLREALNKRYPHKSPDKSLSISVSQFNDQSKTMLMVEILLAGKIEDHEKDERQKKRIADLSLTQELARNLGGEIKFDFTEQEQTKITLILPA